MTKPTICICENKDADQLRGPVQKPPCCFFLETAQILCTKNLLPTVPMKIMTERMQKDENNCFYKGYIQFHGTNYSMEQIIILIITGIMFLLNQL